MAYNPYYIPSPQRLGTESIQLGPQGLPPSPNITNPYIPQQFYQPSQNQPMINSGNIGGITSAVSGVANMVAPQGSAFSNIASGAASGAAFGPVGAAVGAGLGVVMTGINKYKQDKQKQEFAIDSLNNTNKSPSIQTDALGRPIYAEDASYNDILGVRYKDKTSVLGGALIGGALGGVGGAIVGGLLGNRRKKKRQKEVEDARRKALARLQDKQQTFNKANLSFSNQEAINMQNSRLQQERQNRLYNIPQQYSSFV